MSPPIPPIKLPDADLWEYYRGRGLSPEEATLHVERRRAGQPTPPGPSSPTRTRAMLAGAAQGTTMGFADELVGAMQAISNPHLPLTREAIGGQIDITRNEMGAAQSAYPWSALAGNVAGSFANPVARMLPAPTNIARGAVTGSALGGLQGIGEGTGNLPERLSSVPTGAVVGALTGAVLGKLVQKLSPLAKNVWNATLRRFKKTGLAPPQAHAAAEAAAEEAVRGHLRRLGRPNEVIEQVIQTMRQGGQLPIAQPPVPIHTRPGETITKPAPDPLETPAYQRRGVGGHSYTGTYPKGTTPNMPGPPTTPGAPNPQIALQQLQVLVQLPEAEFQQAIGSGLFDLSLQELRQLQAIRVQAGVPGAQLR